MMLLSKLYLLMWLVCRLSSGSDINKNITVSEEFDLQPSSDNFKTSPPEGPDSTTFIGGAVTSPLVPRGSYPRWFTTGPNHQTRLRQTHNTRIHGRRGQSRSSQRLSKPFTTAKTCQYIFTVQNAADCTHTSTEIAVHHVSKTVLPSNDELSELSRRLQRLEQAVYGGSAPEETLQRDDVEIAQVNTRDGEPAVPTNDDQTGEEETESLPSNLIEMARNLLEQISTLESAIASSEMEKKDLRAQNKNLLTTLRRTVSARRNFLALKTNLENALQKTREENARLSSANVTFSKENDALKLRNQKLSSLQESSRTTIRSLEAELVRVKAGAMQRERRVNRMARLNEQLQDKVRNMTSTVETCMKMSSEDESLQYQLEKERETREELEGENAHLKEKLENSSRRLEELEEALRQARNGQRFSVVSTGRRGDQDYSYCGRITEISLPETVRVSQSFFEKYGVWMMDPLEALGTGKIWSMSTLKDKIKELKQYQSLQKFISNQPETTIDLPLYVESNGAVIYNGSLYYQRRNSRKIVRYDLLRKRILREKAVHHAGFHGTFAYQWGGLTDIDLAVDELGLWVIYSTRQNRGNIVVSKLHPETMRMVLTVKTSIPKRTVANAFMACGILYTVDSFNTANASLNYEYDTFKKRSKRISIPLTNQHRFNVMIDYNPLTRELLSWDGSNQVKYYASVDKSLGKVSNLEIRSSRRRRRG